MQAYTAEWALSEAFDAPECVVTDYASLAAIAPAQWPALTLRFHPSLRRIDLHTNAPQIWQSANQQQSLPDFTGNTALQAWIIWRHELKLCFRSLSVPEAFAIDAFRQGQCFAEVCAGLCAWLDAEQVAVSVAGYLQTWLRDGWVIEPHFL